LIVILRVVRWSGWAPKGSLHVAHAFAVTDFDMPQPPAASLTDPDPPPPRHADEKAATASELQQFRSFRTKDPARALYRFHFSAPWLRPEISDGTTKTVTSGTPRRAGLVALALLGGHTSRAGPCSPFPRDFHTQMIETNGTKLHGRVRRHGPRRWCCCTGSATRDMWAPERGAPGF